MATAIIRIDRETVDYVLWSTVVDDAVSGVLTREQAEKELDQRNHRAGRDRFDRADKTGSSWLLDEDRYGEPMFTQRGMLPRNRLREYVALTEQGRPADHLIEPFCDEEAGQ